MQDVCHILIIQNMVAIQGDLFFGIFDLNSVRHKLFQIFILPKCSHICIPEYLHMIQTFTPLPLARHHCMRGTSMLAPREGQETCGEEPS